MSLTWGSLPMLKDQIFHTHHKSSANLSSSHSIFENRLAKMFHSQKRRVIVRATVPFGPLNIQGRKCQHKSTDRLLMNFIPQERINNLNKYVQENQGMTSIPDFRLALVKQNSLVKEINISQNRTTTKSLEPLISS